MSVVWFWAENGHREGPMDWASLLGAARSGKFTPQAWIWTQGYGKDWRRASTLAETLFPPPRKEEGDSGAGGGTGDGVSGTPGAPPFESGAAEPGGPLEERSPFAPRAGEDGRARKVVATRSLLVAFANMRVVLFKPFSFVRYVLFALPVLMAWVGFSTGGVALPLGPVPEAQAERLKSLGLDAAVEPVSAFFEKHAADFSSPAGVADPQVFVSDLASALQRAAKGFSAWIGRPGGLLAAAVGGLVFLALAAVSSWFLSRAWALLLERVYRRDESSGLSWMASARPAATLFKGLFAVKAVILAVETAVFAVAVRFFASLPDGAAQARHAAAFVFAIAAVESLGALTTGFVRDFAVPFVSLRGMSFGAALRAAVRSAGWWFVRYLALSLPILGAAQALSAAFVLAVFGVAGLGGGVTLFSAAYALVAMPWHLVRRLWTLDIAFDIDPALRTALPPPPPLPRAAGASGGGPGAPVG